VLLYAENGVGAPITLPGVVDPEGAASNFGFNIPNTWDEPNPDTYGGPVEPFTFRWTGRELIYSPSRVSGSVAMLDVCAATDDGATAGVIAAGAQVWTVGSATNFSRLFFDRAIGDGVWMVAVPQPH
jgi:hypothetical protein